MLFTLCVLANVLRMDRQRNHPWEKKKKMSRPSCPFQLGESADAHNPHINSLTHTHTVLLPPATLYLSTHSSLQHLVSVHVYHNVLVRLEWCVFWVCLRVAGVLKKYNHLNKIQDTIRVVKKSNFIFFYRGILFYISLSTKSLRHNKH